MDTLNIDELKLQLRQVREERKAKLQNRRRRSKLDRYKGELIAMHEGDASEAEMAHWLATRKQLKVHPVTIGRRLRHWQQEQR